MYMFLHLLFLVALVQFGESQNGDSKSTALNNSSLSLIFEDQCVTRDEVREVIRSEMESVVRTEVESVVRTEVQSISRQVDETQDNIAQLLVLLPGGEANPVPSCKNLLQGSPPGNYWIQPNSRAPATRQYCDMDRTCCDSRGGWMRVANLDMTDPNQQCPSGFRLVSSPKHSCGVLATGCTSVTYPVHGVEYSRVCGRVIGYQKGTTNAFFNFNKEVPVTIDSDNYVDGVSLTHGSSPRKHIWTLAAALDETNELLEFSKCPCTHDDLREIHLPEVPPFVGNDYFCDTGSRNHFEVNRFYHQDPLWDGQGCGARSTCCSFNNPPWFCKHLPQPTRDNIELRLCKDEGDENEDITLEVIELYVQ